jgi:hypothetical protein
LHLTPPVVSGALCCAIFGYCSPAADIGIYYYDFVYEAIIWTEYMEQMNGVVENISFESDEYWGETNNYKFVTKISQFEQLTDLPTTNDRLVRNKFSIDVKAYILPQSALDKNSNRVATTQLQYSPKKVVFDTEILTNTI